MPDVASLATEAMVLMDFPQSLHLVAYFGAREAMQTLIEKRLRGDPPNSYETEDKSWVRLDCMSLDDALRNAEDWKVQA